MDVGELVKDVFAKGRDISDLGVRGHLIDTFEGHINGVYMQVDYAPNGSKYLPEKIKDTLKRLDFNNINALDEILVIKFKQGQIVIGVYNEDHYSICVGSLYPNEALDSIAFLKSLREVFDSFERTRN